MRVIRGAGTGELRHQHDTQGDTEQGRRKFHQAVGISQPTDATGLQMRGNLGVDEQRDLRHADAQQGRQHQLGNAARGRIAPSFAHTFGAQPELGQQTQPKQRRNLHGELQHAADHDASTQRIDGLNPLRFQPRRAEPSGGNHAQIQQHRCGGGHSKALPGVEHAGRQGHQRHEADVRKHPARHDDSCVESARVLLQTTGHRPDQQRRSRHTQHTGQQQHPDQQTGDSVDQQTRGVLPLTCLGSSQHRHKSLTESAFGKQAPEQIRNAERHIECVRHGTGAKSRGDQQLTRQPRDARHQREQGDGRGGFEK